MFRIAKRFTFDAGHRLAKHPELCRFPHGHTYTVEVVLRGAGLDANDMVCDYGVLKAAVGRHLERLDHAMLLSPDDPERERFAPVAERVVVLADGDPTAEVIARSIFEAVRESLRPGTAVTSPGGVVYTVPAGIVVERVRVWETPTSWAEYGGEETGTGDRGPGSGE
ncbi:MAG: 6-carboxytetrahydropterin synthase [Acidobacteria bacterium]|nr:6-carboxytetrahydropterin synthase [Acidobacteriota bacterium]